VSHICNDCVSIVRGHKVLDLARRSGLEVVSADEVRRKIELGRVGARPAIGSAVDFLLCSSSHDIGRDAHTQGGGCRKRGEIRADSRWGVGQIW
jgi:hypothetical protein